MNTAKRVPLYERLPEIYRIRDAEQTPPDQLRALLAAVEGAFGAVHENIEALYNDLFIDTCDPWVIPYIADLVGTTHLAGDAYTLRADVADTIALRRRKGTLGAIERLAANLTGWPCRAVELFHNLAWTQHLNHQRPDTGGMPPYGDPAITRFAVRCGGTVPVRDPAMLSLLGTPFDPFAYTADVKRAGDGAAHMNLPNLAVFLWRLTAYRIAVSRPLAKDDVIDLGVPPAGGNQARFALRIDLDPLDRPLRLFNTYRKPPLNATGGTHVLTEADAVPGPMLDARLTSGSEAGNPAAYVSVDLFDETTTPPTGLDLSDVGLQLYLPHDPNDATDPLTGVSWTFRGDNLCAWEKGLRQPLREHEIVVDPDIGRIVFGLKSQDESDALVQKVGAKLIPRFYTGYTYGAVGAVGAHPDSRDASPTTFAGEAVHLRPVTALGGGASLQAAFDNLHTATQPVVIEIRDSLVHTLDIDTVVGATVVDGPRALQLNRSLIVRAASGQRPIVRLARPLRFRPVNPAAASVATLGVRFEGVFVTRDNGFPAAQPLIARAAVARLEFLHCTLDPGGYRLRDDARAPMAPAALVLRNDYGFANAADEAAFAPTPDVLLQYTVAGALAVDDGYRVTVEASIVDAGKDVGDDASGAFAFASASAPATDWGAALDVREATFLGRVRCAGASGSGGIFVHPLEVWNHQRGCLKYGYFNGQGDRLPPHHACVLGTEARLAFTSTWFSDPGYGQLAAVSDFHIRQRGPGDDAMGAFCFLQEAHKWTNLNIRLREFMPVGVRPLVIAVT